MADTNFFDKFDGHPPASAPGGGAPNVFDKFDNGAPAKPVPIYTPSTDWHSLARNYFAGATEGLTGMAEQAFRLNPYDQVAAGVNPLLKAAGGPQLPQVPVQHLVNESMPLLGGENPEDIKANTAGDRIARMTGAGTTAAMLPMGAEGFLARLAQGSVGGFGAGLGSEMAPEGYKGVGALVGGLAGGFGGPKAGEAATEAGGLTADIYRKATRTQPPPEQAEMIARNFVANLVNNLGMKPEDLTKFDSRGKPMKAGEALGPIGVANWAALGNKVGLTGRDLSQFILDRVTEGPERMLQNVSQGLGIDPQAALGDMKEIVRQGREAVRPLYEAAWAGGGGTAVLIPHLEEAFNVASRNLKQAQQRVADAENAATQASSRFFPDTDSVHATGSYNTANRVASKNIDRANDALALAQKTHDDALARLHQAQEDDAMGLKGGIWSPRLQEFLDHPIIQKGIREGLDIIGLERLKLGEPVPSHDFAVTSYDEEGMPVISRVPNTRLLDAAKLGLDDILEGYRDKTTGKLVLDKKGQQIEGVRKAFLDEVDRLNPDYATARAGAADYMSANNAFWRAQNLIKSTVPHSTFMDWFGKLNSTEQEAARGGVANFMYNQAQRGVLKPAFFDTAVTRQKVNTLMGDRADDFLKDMKVESQIAENNAALIPKKTANSRMLMQNDEQTGTLEGTAHLLYAIKHAKVGNYPWVAAHVMSALRAFGRSSLMPISVRDAAGRMLNMDPEELGRYLMDHEQPNGPDKTTQIVGRMNPALIASQVGNGQ